MNADILVIYGKQRDKRNFEGRKIMKRKINNTTIGMAIFALVLSLLLLLVWGIYNLKINSIQEEKYKGKNVFDQMIENGYPIMTDAEHITIGGYDAVRLFYPVSEEHGMGIGLIYSAQYRKLYIYGAAEMTGAAEGQTCQEWFESCMEEQGISWADMEDYKEDFICGEILEPWFGEGHDYFSKDRLGELEVVDFLMPYEYSGTDMEVPEEEVVHEEEYGGWVIYKLKERIYTTWSLPLIVHCKQESKEYNYADITDRIEDDIKGINTVCEGFVMSKLEFDYSFYEMLRKKGEDVDHIAYNNHLRFYVNDWNGLIKWIQESGKVEGNLTKLAYRREEGETKTLEMLRYYDRQMIKEILSSGEMYFDRDYLYVRFPYCDRTGGKTLWVENGSGIIWQGWLALKWDDIGRFLINFDGVQQ